MKVKFNTEITDTKGKPIVYKHGMQAVMEAMLLAGVKRDEDVVNNLLAGINSFREDKDAKQETLTAATVAMNALDSFADAKDCDGKERTRRAVLSERIYLASQESTSGVMEIAKEDGELILKLIPKVDQRPVVHMRMERMFTAAQAEEDKAATKAADKSAQKTSK